ncbi:MAG: leucyl aminopeptidase [Thermoanaerobaculia bacterium]|nr:leucyl aminopeptidase [Thermoanaerobaculia bacterium]
MPAILDISVSGRRLSGVDHLVVGAFAGEAAPSAALDARSRVAVERLLARGRFSGDEDASREGELARGAAVTLLGLGKAGDFSARKLRRWIERAIAAARSAGAKRLAIALPAHDAAAGEAGGLRAARDAALATYRFESYRSGAKRGALKGIVLLPPPGGGAPAFQRGVEVGLAIAAGAAWARDLANTPPNDATPVWMAARARDGARRWRAKIQILTPVEMKRRGMGGILAVGGGSRNAPRLVRIEVGSGPTTVALVGKGVTFDTGGISIKPAAQMDEMKWDKCGAAAVLGILEAISRLDLAIRVRAYLPLAENMPDGAAYRPGDIVTMSNGKTVEILNTDAEGRMILADALAWAAAEKPDALVEYSTLTGACVVALGPTGAGLFTPHDALAGELLAAAAAADERLWRLPLWEEFLEEMRGVHGDLKNSGGRWGGASTAAAFLSQFVGESTRWAHLDVAGPAYVGEGRERRGATGYGVSLTVEWLRRLAATRRR